MFAQAQSIPIQPRKPALPTALAAAGNKGGCDMGCKGQSQDTNKEGKVVLTASRGLNTHFSFTTAL